MRNWSHKKIRDLIDGLQAGVSVRSSNGIAHKFILKTSSVESGRFLPNESKPILDEDLHRARCNPVANSMIISRMNTPELVGNVGYVTESYKDLFLPDRLWIARPKRGADTDMRWLTYYFASKAGSEQLQSLATGTSGSMKNIAKDHILDLEISVPAPHEQRVISGVLSDIDDLISSLEQLVEKKNSVKQGMMQQLLTGRTRLPGFTEKWKPLAVASNSVVKARIGWQGLTTGEYRSNGTYRLVGGTEFIDGRINWEDVPYVDKWRYDQDPYIQLRTGDVLLTKDGTIGKTAFVDELPGPATLNSGVFVIRPTRGAYDSAFLFYMLRSRAFEEFLARLSAGSTISHLYQRDLITLELKVPPTRDEQRAIAQVLADSDCELSVLQTKLRKARAIKAGIMQQLLTGRVRLPLNGTV